MPELYDHPDEQFVTVIDTDLDAVSALMLDLNDKVVPWAKLMDIIAYSQRHHPRAYLLEQFNCAGCGQRQTIPQPDHIYTEGHCEECDTTTDLRKAGAWVIGLEPAPGKEPQFLGVFAYLASQPDHFKKR